MGLTAKLAQQCATSVKIQPTPALPMSRHQQFAMAQLRAHIDSQCLNGSQACGMLDSASCVYLIQALKKALGLETSGASVSFTDLLKLLHFKSASGPQSNATCIQTTARGA